MSDDQLHVLLRRMTLDDIDQVVAIDQLSFPIPWPVRSYRYELLNNDKSTLLVVEKDEKRTPPDGSRRGWLQRLFNPQQAPPPLILAYSGFWHIADEVHISTIAVHPDWRGRGLGELLVLAMVREAARRGAAIVTLEVRVSNETAQALYRKYGFEITGVRRGYYHDNHEDAYLMTASPLDAAYLARIEQHRGLLARRLHSRTADGLEC
jgi:ribosomal-protein-alanine N-acetyltransferase